MKTKLYISLCFATLSWFIPFPFLLLMTCNICHQMSDILDMTWFSDKTWFHLLGFVNRQNMYIWSVEDPCTIPTVSPSTENGGCYARAHLWISGMSDQILSYFQEDGAVCWATYQSMEEIDSSFGARIISKGLWPPQSPGMTSSCGVCWRLNL